MFNLDIHEIKTIRARSTFTLGAPLIIEVTGEGGRKSSVTLYTRDADLTQALIDAINGVTQRKQDAA